MAEKTKTVRMPVGELLEMRRRIAELEDTSAGREEDGPDNRGRVVELEAANTRLRMEIKELRRTDEALRDSEDKFRSFIEEMNDGYCVIQDSKISFANTRIAQMFGYTKEEVTGKSILELLPPKVIEGMAEVHAKRTRGEEAPPQYETMLISKYGISHPVEFGAKLIEHEGKPAVSVVIRDITQRKQAEAKLQQTMQDLARSNAELEQFAYVASHDLQEPLRMVTSFVQLLARRYQGQLDAEADEYIAFVVDGASRMQTLINDLLIYSRVGTSGNVFEPVDCEKTFQRVIDNLQIAIEDADARITHDPLPTVKADGAQLAQLFQNLIGNAIKFCSEESPRIHVSATQEDKEWVFSVSDNGIGIDPEFSERIFLIFQRLHTRAEYAGTGIGLAICKRIVERHNGHIWIESEPGKGSKFYFTIPVAGGRES